MSFKLEFSINEIAVKAHFVFLYRYSMILTLFIKKCLFFTHGFDTLISINNRDWVCFWTSLFC